MENFNKDESMLNQEFIENFFSKRVRAGNRTYFFDVKKTKKEEYYLAITESKRLFKSDGEPFFEKHKILLYREDFHKWFDALNESLLFIEDNQPLINEIQSYDVVESDFSNIDFDDI